MYDQDFIILLPNCCSSCQVQQFAASVVDFIIFNETDEYDVTRKNITIEGNVAGEHINLLDIVSSYLTTHILSYSHPC